MAKAEDSTRWLAPFARNLAAFFHPLGRRSVKWDDGWASDCGLPDHGQQCHAPPAAGRRGRPGTDVPAGRVFRESGSPWVMWSAWPTPDLETLGYQSAGHPPLMVRAPGTTARPLPDGLRIIEVRDSDMLTRFDRVFIEWYPLDALQGADNLRLIPPSALGAGPHFWIGFAGDDPETVAAACVADGIVGVNCVATSPEARGRGYGAAITDLAARCDPALPAVLLSSDLGYQVYQRLGFETVSHYTLWQKPASR